MLYQTEPRPHGCAASASCTLPPYQTEPRAGAGACQCVKVPPYQTEPPPHGRAVPAICTPPQYQTEPPPLPGGPLPARAALLPALAASGRGLAPPPVLRRQFATAPTPTGAAADRHLTVVASTDAPDRHGDTVALDGWHLDGYRDNPVLLWAHDYRQPPIGRAPAVWRDGPALLARLEFAPTPFAQEVEKLYRQGYQRAVSVGFRPLRFAERRDLHSGALLGIRFLEQELLEISAVPVPANREALLRAVPSPFPTTAELAGEVITLLRGLRP